MEAGGRAPGGRVGKGEGLPALPGGSDLFPDCRLTNAAVHGLVRTPVVLMPFKSWSVLPHHALPPFQNVSFQWVLLLPPLWRGSSKGQT